MNVLICQQILAPGDLPAREEQTDGGEEDHVDADDEIVESVHRSDHSCLLVGMQSTLKS